MIKRLLFFLSIIISFTAKGQCPQVYDYLGNLSPHPYFISCTGSSYNLNFQSNSSWGAYSINYGDGSPTVNGASYTANTILTHNYATVVDTFVVTLIIPALNCTLTGIVVMEKPVNASIQIPIGGVTQACAPKTLSFTNSSTDVSPTTNFIWNFGDGSPTVAFTYTNGGQTITHTYLKNTVNCQTQITLQAMNYCSFGNPTIANFNPIQIYDVDQAAITPDKLIRCWPDNVFTFTNTTQRNCLAQGNTFQRQEWWNFGMYWPPINHDSIIDWKPWPPTTPISIAYPAVGTYSVMLRDSNLCGVDTAIINVQIVNPPTASLVAPPGPLCQNAPLTFTNASPTGFSYLWDFGTGGGFVNLGNGPQTHVYATPGTYTVQLAAFIPGAGAACTSTVQVVVTILPSPTANFVNTPTVGCNVLNNVVFNESSIGAVSWNWNFGNSNTSSVQIPPNQNYPAPGTYTVSLSVTAANGCVNTKTASIIVHPNPIASFTPTSTCVGSITSFSSTSTVTGTNAINSYTWNFGDTSPNSNIQNPPHTYTAPATYTVKLIVSTAFCKDSTTNLVTANIKPAANFVFTPTVGCPPFPVSFTNTSVNGVNYIWNFGVIPTATSNAVNANFTYSNTLQATVNHTVSLIASTGLGCSDTARKVVSILPRPVSSFTGNLTPGCSPLPVTFTNNSIGASTYSWTFGDNTSSTTLNPSHTYTNNTFLLITNTITLVVTNSVGCSDTSKQTIQIFPKTFTSFTMIPASGCTPLLVSFPSVPGVISYTWSYGDGSPSVITSTAPSTHVFTNTTTATQTFTVRLVASNGFGCVDSSFGNPVVFPKPIPDFNASPVSGCSPLVVSFSNTSTGNNSSAWLFNNGNASITTNPVETFTNVPGGGPITYSVKLVVGTANNCYDSIVKPISLFARPKSTLLVDTPACSPANLTFTNTSLGASSYNWNFGNSITSTLTSPSQVYTNIFPTNQVFTVTLVSTNSNGCKDTLKVPIIVHPTPVFFISALPDSGCTPLKVFFPPIVGVQQYQWTYGDGNTASTGSVSNTFVNVSSINKTFTVQLIAKDNYGCPDTTTRVIKVFPKPSAFFKADPLLVFVPNQPTQCYNLSTGAVSYQWDFGDGGTATSFEPSHTYLLPGEYQITLVATSNKGCRDTFDLSSKIVALEETFVEVPNAFTPNIGGSPGSAYDPLDKSNDIFHPNIRGTEKYVLSIYSRWGELLFETKNPAEGWDGYYKGKMCTQDVYIWKITATFIDGKAFNKTGDVLLLK
ncbi:MAG: PKD domain-containing protein [Bacteroidota bacterium]|nr:PKD domain-containing protein [Bacteroidota bacterium]